MSNSLKLTDLIDWQYARVNSTALKHALKVQSEVIKASGDFLHSQGFVQILPVIMSPITDPLRHATGKAEIEYYDQRYQITRSMILHKQMIILAHDKIFVFSPNIRLEPVELADTGRHLAEFTQLDLEMKGASRDDLIDLGQNLLIYTLTQVKQRCEAELGFFNRRLTIPTKPFERIAYREAYDRYGANFDVVISQLHQQPVWIVDIPIEMREFYDREDLERPGTLVDYDLLYPEGFNEALSGGEREHTYERILTRIQRSGLDPENFRLFLEFAQRGLPASAGFGIGMERLTRFICGLKRVEDVAHFPKIPGQLSL